jgi:hypothetical protein
MSSGARAKIEQLKKKAEEALAKPPAFGPDLDLSKYKYEAEKPKDWLTKDLAERAELVGIDLGERQRAGTYLQLDHFSIIEKATAGGVEVMSISKALESYEWLADYYWRALSVDTDKFTALAEVKRTEGYFIRAKKGVKVDFPIQACPVPEDSEGRPKRPQRNSGRGGGRAPRDNWLRDPEGCRGAPRGRVRVLRQEGRQALLHYDPRLGRGRRREA